MDDSSYFQTKKINKPRFANTDGIIHKLVMVFAICSYSLDRFVMDLYRDRAPAPIKLCVP